MSCTASRNVNPTPRASRRRRGLTAVEVNPPILEQPDFQPVSSAAVTPAEANESETNSEVTDLDVMFSMLAAEHRRGDPTQTLADRLEDKSTRIAVMVGGTMVVALLAFVALTVLGAIF